MKQSTFDRLEVAYWVSLVFLCAVIVACCTGQEITTPEAIILILIEAGILVLHSVIVEGKKRGY